MKYQKPELVLVGEAIESIQSGLTKVDSENDSPNGLTISAYRSDE